MEFSHLLCSFFDVAVRDTESGAQYEARDDTEKALPYGSIDL